MNELRENGNPQGDYQIINQIGHGAHGAVYKVLCLKSKLYKALKKIDLKSGKNRQNFINEVLILERLSHPNIVQIESHFI